MTTFEQVEKERTRIIETYSNDSQEMKQLRQQHSHYNSKAWTSLDCLLTSLPISPISQSSQMIMRSTMNLQLSDTRRISPQTTTSSGYHSDLSSATSANQSPQSIQDILPDTLDKSVSSSISTQKKTVPNYEKSTTHKNLSRLSSFLRRQYERARTKLSSVTHHHHPSVPSSSSTSSSTSQQKTSSVSTTVVHTCSKGTSTTPLSHLSSTTYAYPTKSQQKTYYQPQYLSAVYKQSSYGEPVYSIYVHPKQTHSVKLPHSHSHANYSSIHEYYSQPMSTSYHHSNYSSKNYNRRHQYYPVELPVQQNYHSCYSKNVSQHTCEPSRSTYAPLSDFVSTKNSAFKPIIHKRQKYHPRPTESIYDQIPLSDDPCDLEVAQYFPQTSQWSNPNYFDIYTKDIIVTKTKYTETLC